MDILQSNFEQNLLTISGLKQPYLAKTGQHIINIKTQENILVEWFVHWAVNIKKISITFASPAKTNEVQEYSWTSYKT